MELWWWCCCCDDVVVVAVATVMVMVKIDYDVVCLLATFFWCLSCWCLGGLSIVFRWSLVSWWHFGGVSIDTLLLGLYAGLILLFVQSECRPDTNYQPWQLIQDLIAIMVVNVQSYAKLGNGGKRFRCKHTRPWRRTRACTETKTQNRFAAFALAKYIHFTVARTSTRKTRVLQTNDKKEEPIHHCWQKLVASWFLQKIW